MGWYNLGIFWWLLISTLKGICDTKTCLPSYAGLVFLAFRCELYNFLVCKSGTLSQDFICHSGRQRRKALLRRLSAQRNNICNTGALSRRNITTRSGTGVLAISLTIIRSILSLVYQRLLNKHVFSIKGDSILTLSPLVLKLYLLSSLLLIFHKSMKIVLCYSAQHKIKKED
jgi:hypothetical protein